MDKKGANSQVLTGKQQNTRESEKMGCRRANRRGFKDLEMGYTQTEEVEAT
jgi:hypothetical protein